MDPMAPATGGVAIPEYVLSAILQWNVFWLRKLCEAWGSPSLEMVRGPMKRYLYF